MAYTEVRLIRTAEGQHLLDSEIVDGRATFSMLTTDGVGQARRLGEAWHDEGYQPDAVHTSPLLRAADTLHIAQMTGKLSLPPDIRPALTEQCLGYFEGRRRDEAYTPYIVDQMIGVQGALFRYQGKNAAGDKGERLTEAAMRGYEYLRAVHAEADGAKISVAAIGHRVAIQGLATYIMLGCDEMPANPLEFQRQSEALSIEPCAESLFIIEGGQADYDMRVKIEYVGKPLED